MKVYTLEVQNNEIQDLDYDAYALDFEGLGYLGARLMIPREFSCPNPMCFLTDFRFIADWDYIDNDQAIPILSDRFVQVLQSIGEFNHRVLPITMIDDSYLEHQFDENSNLKSEVGRNSAFCALHLLEYTDVFDFENSDFELDDYDDDSEPEVGYIDELVLKEPENGFPPIFRIKEDLTLLFVSEEAKQAIEKEGLVGCIFEEVEVS